MSIDQIEAVQKLNKETGIGLILSRLILEEFEYDYDSALEYIKSDSFTDKYILRK